MNNNTFDRIHIENLISENDTVLIGLSGGADSVFLTEYLISIRDKYSLTLKAAHIEHGIRGEESLSDCRFVEDYCFKNNIECFVLHIKAKEESEILGMGVEEYSRSKRYEFFSSVECDKIATAHNLNDNIETLIFRLVRGTSIKGACGIPQKRDKIIRPLLNITSDEIRNFLNESGITYCIDSTNQSNDYSRNHIRNNILPLFRTVNSDYETAVNRFILNVNQDNDFMESEADKAFSIAYCDNSLKINELKKYHISIIKRILIRYFSLNGIRIDELHINEVLSLIDKPSKIQLSGDLFAVSNKSALRIADFNVNRCTEFSFTKEKYSFKEFLNKCELCGKGFAFYCDYDKIVGNVSVRARKEGDKISPAGRGCTKTLKKLYNELSVPAEIRNSIPVITDDLGIIGIYGYFSDERVKIDKTTENVLIVNVSTEDNV